MAISISHEACCECRDLFDITFFDYDIEVAVTSKPEFVGTWISNILHIFRRYVYRGNLIGGIDVEWRPNFDRNSPQNPVSILQLCIGHLCLVFQLQYASSIPQELYDFLGDDDYTFVGVGISEDARKLENDYGLEVSNCVDLRFLAAERFGKNELRNTGLTGLAKEVLDLNYYKPRTLTMSNWAKEELSHAQIKYAAIDAFLSFEIGKCLNASN